MNLDGMNLTEPQRQAIECVNGPLLLCAGAGSGKTFTLQQRIAYALSPESGPAVNSVDEIMAITFTNKAAEEIKSRVRAVLRSEGMFDEALKVDGAWVSTIHAMALRVLRAHALEFGFDPALVQLDGVEAEALRSRAFSEALEAARNVAPAAGGSDVSLQALLSEYGVSGLRNLVDLLHEKSGPLPDPATAIDFGPASTVGLAGLCRQLVVLLEGLAQEDLKPKARETLDGTLGIARDFLAVIVADEQANQASAVGGTAEPADGTSSKTSAKASIQASAETTASFVAFLDSLKLPTASGSCKEAVNDVRSAIDALKLQAVLAYGAHLRDAFLAFANVVEQRYSELKRHAGGIDMSDTLRLAYDALRAHPDIAADIRNRFKLIMVDEFQDTNRLQIELIKLLCGENLSNLCTVGDAQQSIYRFQGADVNVYFGHKAEMTDEAGALPLNLDSNFRSNADILAFVRKVCSAPAFFPEPFLDLSAGRDEDRVLKEGRAYPAEMPRIQVALTQYRSASGGRPGASVAQAKQVEAEAVASWFAELHEAGVQPSDMVILMGATTHADAYADALRRKGLPCIMTGGSGFYKRTEAMLVGQMLRMLAAPYDTEALFAVLSSGMMCLSADELLQLTTLFPDENPEEVTIPRRCNLDKKLFPERLEYADGRIGFASAMLNRAWEHVGNARPSEIIQGLLVQSGFLARLEAGGAEDMAVAANLVKAVRIVADIEAEAGFDMAQTARRYGELAAENEKLGSLMGDVGGSVRIMTAHSSKGLEFPYVAVVDCYDARADYGKLATYSYAGHLYASLMPGGDIAQSGLGKRFLDREKEHAREVYEETVAHGEVFNPGAYMAGASSPEEFYARIKALGALEALLERRRLFYVAATRASEAMFVAMTVRANKDNALNMTGVAGDVITALFNDEEAVCMNGGVDYGGSEPLAYQFFDVNVLLEGDSEEGKSEEGDSEEGDVEPSECDSERPMVVYPALEKHPVGCLTVPQKAPSQVVSYTSLAKEHETAPADVSMSLAGLDGLAEEDGGANIKRADAVSDADKATDFGNALHRLAQISVLQGEDVARSAVRKQAALQGVQDVARLETALNRWLVSDVRREAQSYENLLPEYPFAVKLGEKTLQGFIDLLCVSGSKALVVDYKTGGSPHETADQLQAKHLLQAQSYAYALLSSGLSEVKLTFVRVEQPDASNPAQPQTVTYHFTATDLPTLSAALTTT